VKCRKQKSPEGLDRIALCIRRKREEEEGGGGEGGDGAQTESELCPRGAQTCALPLFCDRVLEINSMTLKLENDLDVLKRYHHSENEAAS